MNLHNYVLRNATAALWESTIFSLERRGNCTPLAGWYSWRKCTDFLLEFYRCWFTLLWFTIRSENSGANFHRDRCLRDVDCTTASSSLLRWGGNQWRLNIVRGASSAPLPAALHSYVHQPTHAPDENRMTVLALKSLRLHGRSSILSQLQCLVIGSPEPLDKYEWAVGPRRKLPQHSSTRFHCVYNSVACY